MKFFLLNGGGMDSLAVAKIAREQYPDATIISMHINYGLPSFPRTRVAAKAIADVYCNSHEELYVCKGNEDKIVPLDDFTIRMEGAGGFIGIPYWGTLLMITGYAHATYYRCDAMLTGLRSDAYEREVFAYFEKLVSSSKMMRRYLEKRPTIEAPLFGQDPLVIKHIIKDDPLLSSTWSCNRPNECGKCNKCVLRKEHNIFYKGE